MKEILSMKQVTYLLKGFTLLFLMTFLFACSNDEDPIPPDPGTNVGGDSSETTPTVPPTQPPEEPPVSEALEGTWKTRCLGKDDGVGSALLTMTFTQTDFSGERQDYSDGSCSDKTDSPKDISGTYTIGNKVTPPEGYEAYEIDLHSPGGSTSESLIALKNDKMLLTFTETRPSSFNSALEFTKSAEGSTEGNDLEGRWGTDCLALDDGESGTISFDFNKSQFTQFLVIYSDSKCKTEDRKGSFPGKTVIGETVTTDDDITAKELDLKFDDGVVDKRIYAKGKVDESGRVALVISQPTKDKSRPTSLKPATAYFQSSDAKSTAMSSTKELVSTENIEIQGYASPPELTPEIKEKLERTIGIPDGTGRSFIQTLRGMDDQLLNQEGLRSGNW